MSCPVQGVRVTAGISDYYVALGLLEMVVPTPGSVRTVTPMRDGYRVDGRPLPLVHMAVAVPPGIQRAFIDKRPLARQLLAVHLGLTGAVTATP